MGNVLHKDELDSAIGSSIFSSLESDASDAESLLQTISAYVENSRDKLKGETWKA